ncbi:hypothetical protein O0I10_009692 [Lichtheimia ornata]|uniref:CENP-V/GFA domain-containing protein n=1 Tax=Lichtheimia ornata TaxID=688661 RepID=A0AAD7UYY2_9FUNG|nr:uncharacterized protein O0I10_009692 [Lichtheimia ornata]KAJ8654641.1 hypothetical protein O0I10_009692 [Lichtheimia ornata]
MSTTPLKGSCLCGNVKLTLKGNPVKVMTCYCVHCQKSGSAPYQTNAIFPTDQIEIDDPQGFIKMYTVPKEEIDSGFEKQKYFCSNCGCPLFNRPMKHQGTKTVVKTGILDAPAGSGIPGSEVLKPAVEIFTKDRASYVAPIEGCAQFEKAAS